MNKTEPVENVWSKTRAIIHAQVIDVALGMFLENGFDNTTLEQITRATGISKRSFFRYFGTKEDIVLGDLENQGRILAEALAARPAEENPWIALERAVTSLPSSKYSDERAFAIAKLVLETPSLYARHAQKHAEWQRVLVPIIQERMGNTSSIPDIKATAIVASAIACLDAAMNVWVRGERKKSFTHLYAEAMDTVRGR